MDHLAFVAAPRGLLDVLVAGDEVDVALRPETGLSVTGDWWSARLDALGVQCTDYGTDAALIGLAQKVRAEVSRRIEEPVDPREAPLVLRLWLASEGQTLGRLLERSARVWGWDYDESCVEENMRPDPFLDARRRSWGVRIDSAG